jgi:hypothetical protein
MNQEQIQSTVHHFQEIFGMELSDSEKAVLDRIKFLLTRVLESKRGFNIVIEIISTKLLNIARSQFNLNSITNVDLREFERKASEISDLLTADSDQLTEKEDNFARDVIGLVDFSARNGIGLGLVANLLAHDIREILIHKNLDTALASGFRPKVSGWAKRNQQPVGNPDESEE